MLLPSVSVIEVIESVMSVSLKTGTPVQDGDPILKLLRGVYRP